MEPRYLQVANALETRIARRSPGSILPSEHELARTHSVSRLTARAALEELERRYLVRRAQGKRTLVARRVDYMISPQTPASWSETVRMGGAEPRSDTERLCLRRTPAGVAAILGLRTPSSALLLQRRRFVNGELAAVADTWLDPQAVPMLGERLAHDGSLYRTFAEVYKLAPIRSRARAEFVVASRAVARRLECEGRPMVLKLSGTSCSARTNRPIECTTSWLRADIFNVVFELGGAHEA